MAKIDTSDWKEFVFGEVFEIQSQKEVSPIYALNNSQRSDVLYPFLGQSSENNCIISYIHLDDELLLNNKEKDVAIIIQSNNHLSFCIDEPFYLKDGHGATSIFKNRHLNMYNVRFIIAVLNKTMENLFNYDVKATKDSLKTMVVKLPTTSVGQPDWNYMEQYMQNVLNEVEINFESLGQIDKRKHEINISDWKEFIIGDLFDIHPTKAYKKINIELFEEDGTNPVVVNTGFNNGIGGYASLNCTEKAGTITFTDTAAKSTDSFFYQERDFIGYPHVQGMYAKTHEWTKNEGLFLNSVIKSLLKGQYDFIRKMTRAEMLKLKVKLPAVIKEGAWIPDWSYMENYMQSTIELAEKMMNDFEKLNIKN